MALLHAVVADPEGRPEEREQHQQEQGLPFLFRGFLVLVGIVAGHLGAGGLHRHIGQRRAEGNVDLHPAVDGPAVALEDRAEGALPELEPGDDHRRHGDDEDEAHEQQRILPDLQLEDVAEDQGQRADRAGDDHADRRDGPHVDFLWLGLWLVGIGGLFGGGRHPGRRFRIRGGGALRDLFLDHAEELLVRGPEGLPDADRVVHDVGDDGIPVAALPVVEHAVAPHEEVVAVALREAGRDLHRGAGALAVHVGDVGLAHRRERVRAVDADAQFGAAAVEVERAGLEDRPAVARVKVGEVDEIVQQRAQVAVVVGQPVHIGDGLELRLERLVLRHEGGERRLPLPRKDLLDAGETESLDRRAGLAAQPRLVGGEFCVERRPFGRRERGLGRPINRGDRRLMQGGERRGPGGVDALQQRQVPAGLNPRQREARHFLGGNFQVLGRDGQILAFVPVERRDGAGVERGQPAAGEKILHLGAHGLERGDRGVGGGTQHRDVLGRTLLDPRGVGGQLGKENFHLFRGYAHRAGAVRRTAKTGDDVLD